MNTAAKEESTSGLLAVLLETRVRGSAPKNTTDISPEPSVSSTLRWDSWQAYDRTAVERLVGLDDFGARYFSGAQGRFTSPDVPLLDQHADNPQSWNMYTYGRNNPLRFSDPTGRCVVDEEKHNWFWCLAHDLGYVETEEEKQLQRGRYQEAKAAWEKEHPDTPYWLHQMDVQLGFMPMVGEVSIAGEGAEGLLALRTALKLKPVNLPAWRTIGIDMEEILSGHTAEGVRAIQSGIKDLFPPGMTSEQIERAVRQAYRYGEKVATQGERVLVRGQSNGLTIEMWVNRTTRTIETAYPKF